MGDFHTQPGTERAPKPEGCDPCGYPECGCQGVIKLENVAGKKLAAALYEVECYGIGATSDTNQRVILQAAKNYAASQGAAPVAWIVKWTTVHTPQNASAYLNEIDATRAAKNVAMYAHASDVVVIPTFASVAVPLEGRGGAT